MPHKATQIKVDEIIGRVVDLNLEQRGGEGVSSFHFNLLG